MTTNGIPVDVQMESHHSAGGGQRHVEQFNSSGTIWVHDDQWIVRFVEQMEEKAGMTTLKVQKDRLTLLRHGNMTMRQTFQLHKQSAGTYRLPFGMFHLSTYTERLERLTFDDSWRIEWRYRLTLNDTDAGEFHIRVTMKSVKMG